MTSVAETTVRGVLASLRSSEPAPAGTAASALAAAVGASLLARTGSRPDPRAASSQDQARLRDATIRATAFADRLVSLADDGRPGVEVPLEVLRACAAAVKGAIALSELGNRTAAADVEVALELLLAAARGARRMVDVRLAGVSDPDEAARVSGECARLEQETDRDAGAARRHLAE